MPAAEEVSQAYRGSLVIPSVKWQRRHLILGILGFETTVWLPLVLLPLDVFIKKNFFVTFWWLSSVSTIPFVSLFSHISRMNAFDAISSSSSSSLSLELQPSGMPHWNRAWGRFSCGGDAGAVGNHYGV